MKVAFTLNGQAADWEGAPVARLAAALRDKGFRKFDAYTPFPVHGLEKAMGLKPTKLPLIVLIGGICGGLGGYMLEYWSSVIAYPMNIGGRPFHSWPQFIPVTFECTILGAALSAVVQRSRPGV